MKTVCKSNDNAKIQKLKAAVLKYDESSPAPFLVAKGKGETAKKIRELAEEKKIPVVENIEETEVITLLEIGQCIPEETFEIMAKIFAFIKRL